MKIEIIVKDNPKLEDPIAICGLPGSAFVGKLAVDHMISDLPALPLAEFYCDGFPPQVLVGDGGITSLMKSEMFYWRNTRGGRDLIFFTGDSQPSTPESEYELSDAVVEYMKNNYGAKELITLGAFVTGSFSESPKVYAAASDATLTKKVQSLGCVLMNDGAITGMNGILLGMAKLKGLSGYALLGETSGYVLDPRASEHVLLSLEKITGVQVNMKKLQERAKEAEAVFQTIDRMRRQQQGETSSLPSERKKLDYIS